ncbi:hypothetical protein [Opitutus sp. GAS368]|uniref:DUF1425 domain-containing protein n=1 Tax=Opitutus sp. GAS368 TaxID=1882749 RepID=UPI00087D4C48|nr:hypothetical protein [Opitutus sp. GAS368]SDS02629.1 hypothetical protein SAMN05444173_1664 [Opitutus sp. GAS368]
MKIPLTPLILSWLLAGCASEPAAFLPEESAKYSLENTEKFQLLDRPVQEAVSCTGLQERFGESGRLEVVANLRNHGREAITMQVRCVFKDAADVPTGDETPWQALNLAAGDTEAVRYSAGNNLARKFTILVRAAR